VAESTEPAVISVSQLNRHIRDILEGRFPVLWLKGEISNFKAHTSGHFYFSLKDAKAQINAVMFRGFNSQLRFRPEDGMEVLVRGKITVYEPRGNYQIFCETMEPVGAGALQKAFEQLKAKLQREGLFDEARKRALPALPKHIAIVTSPTGAAIRDMLNVLGRRFKGVDITVVPCKVQGDQAPREIVAAIQLAQRLPDVDVMIVGRGGGSIEDLWAFNDEVVARAISASRVPVISAVGHEVDFTIADFVADLRAPTPSAAAELVVRNAADLAERVSSLGRALRIGLLRKLNLSRQMTVALSKRLVDPQRRIQDSVLRCDELRQRLDGAMERAIETRRMPIAGFELRLKNGIRNLLLRKREGVERNMALLDSLSPLKVLDRGYSMVVSDGEIVTSASTLKVGQSVSVRMCKGSIEAQVTKVEENKR
jgi:exodeoxyribonuclease VII large subunit